MSVNRFKKLFYPYGLWMLIFLIIPILYLFYLAFTNEASVLSMENFARVFEPKNMKVILRSFNIAFISTLICLLIGYPLAYFMSKLNKKLRAIIMMLLMIPMWMNFLLRTYSWVTILSKKGLLNTLLTSLGLSPINIMYTKSAIILGMVYNFLPFMVLPIYTSLEKMDQSLIEAGKDLGCNKANLFKKIIFPLSMPGVISGISMVFIPALSTFEITGLLGGNKVNLIGNIIEQQFTVTSNWNYGASLSVLLMVFIVISLIADSMENAKFSNKSKKKSKEVGGK